MRHRTPGSAAIIRRVEIAGAGIAGLTAACVLAQRGWRVRIHESSDELREMGAGIYLRINSLMVLKEIGILDEVRSAGMRLKEAHVVDHRNVRIARRMTAPNDEAMTVLRSCLHRALADRAIALGADVLTSSTVTGADPEGMLRTASHGDFPADLVIGADGYRSVVREQAGLTASITTLKEGATRVLAPRHGNEREGLTVEYWSGDCRMGGAPCSPDHIYLYLIGRESNPRMRAIPLDKAFWTERFAGLAELIARIPEDAGRHDPLVMVRVRGWSRGRVAILGDAAHAQPPNLGQGAGMSIANASALAAVLDQAGDVTTALAQWEMQRRPVSEDVQRWSHRYGLLCHGFPIQRARAGLIRGIAANQFTNRKWAWLQRGGHHAGELSTNA